MLRYGIVMSLALLVSMPVSADQTDSRLEALFATLTS